jgi:sodium transport system ATP-binding protein
VIHRGEILAMGSIEELIDQHEQPDVEELFFELIRKHDEQVPVTA